MTGVTADDFLLIVLHAGKPGELMAIYLWKSR
jgi:hypothetical protein